MGGEGAEKKRKNLDSLNFENSKLDECAKLITFSDLCNTYTYYYSYMHIIIYIYTRNITTM